MKYFTAIMIISLVSLAGCSSTSTATKPTTTEAAKTAQAAQAAQAAKAKQPTVRYTCSSLSASNADYLYKIGHSYLDRDGDGKPCEPTDYPKAAPKSNIKSGSNCHYVGGYRRKSGTYVRGHMRCR